MELRPYQAAALDALWRWFETNDDGDPIVEASVGAGKSVMIAELCRRALAQVPDTRILMCVHVKELLEQNLAKLVQVWPSAPVGVYSASVGARQLGRAITYATVASIHKRVHQLGRVDIMLVDECHLISDNDGTMYRTLISELRRYCPHMRVIGWTGTAFRGDGIWLTQQGLFTHVAAKITMADLLKQGYLAPLHSVATEQRIDTSGVRTSGADYVVSALAKVSDTAERVQAACAEIATLAADRQKWLIFAVTVEHAQHVAAELRTAHGIACEVVSADTPKTEREAHIKGLRSGKLRALVNVAVLTTGFDVPELDCIALLRATKSPVLYVQIAGRGMRIAPGKVDCLWLDFTDTTATLGPVDAIKGRARPPKREAAADGERAPMVKHCEACGNPSPIAAPTCEACGAVFPPPERVNHGTSASGAAVISTDTAAASITAVSYSQHPGREGKPDTLRVDYYSGFRRVASEWVCFEHHGYARAKAAAWWERRSDQPVPATVAEALALSPDLLEPGRIHIRQNGKYPEIVRHEHFTNAASRAAAASGNTHDAAAPARHPPGPGQPAAFL
jgi:DNA repair protein RadD